MVTSSDSDAVLPVVHGLLVEYRRALVSSLSFADTLMRELPPDSFTWATLVRYWAWQEMKRAQESTDETDWAAHRLACNGMEMRTGKYRIRPFKSLDAGPPPPGPSKVKIEYYQQGKNSDFEQRYLIEDEARPEGANLLLDWSVDSERSPIIAISKPIGLWAYRGEPRIEWRRTVDFGDGDGGNSGLRFTPFDDGGSDWDFRRNVDRSELHAGEA